MQSIIKRACLMLLILTAFHFISDAQTNEDAIMLAKQNLCIGGMYSHSNWNKYREGTFKRNNQNLETLSTNMYAVQVNYGITNKLDFYLGYHTYKMDCDSGLVTGAKVGNYAVLRVQHDEAE